MVLVVVAILALGGYFFLQQSQNLQTNRPAATTQANSATIEIKDFKHSPATLTVKAGQTVTVVNKDITGHSVTSDKSGMFDTGVLGQNETATFQAPTTAGTYGYHCTPHPNMKATLIVE